MKRGRLPLTALHSFEVAGRLRRSTLAAAELFISQAAVNGQASELEAMPGRALFERRDHRDHLTPAGETLLSLLTSPFDDIADCLENLQGDALSSIVSISSETSFAACWLVPHLSGFQRQHPGIDVNVDADP